MSEENHGSRRLRLALCQMRVTADKRENLLRAKQMAAEAAAGGAQLVMLPEMFSCPYENSAFPVYAEEGEGESFRCLSEIAGQNRITLVGGSIPEKCGDRIYNTSLIFGPDGQLLGRHRKVHLFDVDVPGGITFRESDTLTAGDRLTVVDTPAGRIGVAICFDIRFAEMFRAMAVQGAQLICIPAAFNMTTGPAHWELSFRMRAVDNQCFFAGCSPARDEASNYVAYGHSIVTDPWGRVIIQADETQQVIFADIDLADTDRIRQQLPIMREFLSKSSEERSRKR